MVFLITVNIALYLTALLIVPVVISFGDPMTFLSPNTLVLFKLGASGKFPVFAEDRWWTLITANYLHGSLLHLVFNVLLCARSARSTSRSMRPAACS